MNRIKLILVILNCVFLNNRNTGYCNDNKLLCLSCIDEFNVYNLIIYSQLYQRLYIVYDNRSNNIILIRNKKIRICMSISVDSGL